MPLTILIPIKRVIDPYVRIRVNESHTGVERNNTKMAINPFDEIAIEAALQCREQGQITVDQIILVSLGDSSVVESLRQGLALGADKAIHVHTDQPADLTPLTVAKALKNLASAQKANLILMGKQAIDDDSNQVGQMLAALLDWPQATFCSKISITETQIEATREIDGGLETLQLSLPAVLTTDLRLNEPRYASLPNIMKARSKPIDDIALTELLPSHSSTLQPLAVTPPPPRQAGIRCQSVADLVQALREKEKLV